MTRNYSIDEFRTLVRDNKADSKEIVVRSQIADAVEIKADAAETRKITFTISTASVDRQNDIVSLDGWDVKNFTKNPVVLWAHNYRQIPVGRSGKPFVSGDALKAEVEFTPKGMDPFNDTVFEMYQMGFMRAVSVGFKPVKWNWNETRSNGIDFMEQELLEFSAVPVPANPEALMDAKSSGVDVEPLLVWARSIEREYGKLPMVECFPEWSKTFAYELAMAFASVGIKEADITNIERNTRSPETNAWAIQSRRREIEILNL